MDVNLYRQEMLDVYRNPSNFGELEGCTHESLESSPSCGDEIRLQLRVVNGVIEDAKFLGRGCVVSTVSSEFLTEELKGMSLVDARNLTSEDIFDMLKIKISPARIKCALVPFVALKKSLEC